MSVDVVDSSPNDGLMHVFVLLAGCSPEGVPRLFDLVTVRDDKFKTAFYFALRDTLVSENLTQATRIGLQVSVCAQARWGASHFHVKSLLDVVAFGGCGHARGGCVTGSSLWEEVWLTLQVGLQSVTHALLH